MVAAVEESKPSLRNRLPVDSTVLDKNGRTGKVTRHLRGAYVEISWEGKPATRHHRDSINSLSVRVIAAPTEETFPACDKSQLETLKSCDRCQHGDVKPCAEGMAVSCKLSHLPGAIIAGEMMAQVQAQSCKDFDLSEYLQINSDLEADASAISPNQNSSLTSHPSDRLSDLAAQINTLHSQGSEAEATAIAAGKAALQLRKEEGDRLLEAKAQLKHGQWGKWLKANCPTISERSCQLYMQLAEGWEEHIAKNEAVADLTLREAIALLPKKTKALPKPTATPSPIDYIPLPEPRPVWFKVGDTWTEGQAIAQNQRGMVRIMWGEERESDIPGEQMQWAVPEQQSAVSAETKAGLAAAGLAICTPSITPTEFNREMRGGEPPAVSYTPTVSPPVACQICKHRTPIDGIEQDRYWCEMGEFDDTLPNKYDWAKDGNEGTCKSFNAPNSALYDRALECERQAAMEPEAPTVRLKVKRHGVGVEVLGAIVQINGTTHYLQHENLILEDF